MRCRTVPETAGHFCIHTLLLPARYIVTGMTHNSEACLAVVTIYVTRNTVCRTRSLPNATFYPPFASIAKGEVFVLLYVFYPPFARAKGEVFVLLLQFYSFFCQRANCSRGFYRVGQKFEFLTISSLYVPYISATAKNRGLQTAYEAF